METAVLYFKIMFAAVFVQNFVLSKFLGLCPFVGVSKRRDAAIGMGMAVIFVMTLASVATMLVFRLVLVPEWRWGETLVKPGGMESYLDIVSFIVIIAALVQFVEMAMRKLAPPLYKSLGIYLPLITTNCAVLGVTQLNVIDFSEDSLGGALARVKPMPAKMPLTVLMAGIRERLESAPVPKCLQGVPIAFVCAACMALAFFGFAGIV